MAFATKFIRTVDLSPLRGGRQKRVENHPSLIRSSEEEEEEEELDESELDFMDEVDFNSSSTTSTSPGPEVVDPLPIYVPPPQGEEIIYDANEKTDKLPTRISNTTLNKPETATQNSRPSTSSTSTFRGRIEIVRKVIRKYFCKICMAEVPSLEGLRVHLDRQHKIRVKGAPRLAEVEQSKEDEKEGEGQTAALGHVSDLIKTSDAQPRTIEPLPEPEHEAESDPWSDCDDYDDFHFVSLPYPRMKESVVTTMTRREARWALEIQKEREKPGFLEKLEGFTQCSSCVIELSLDPHSRLLRKEHERLHADGSYKACPHCAMPFLYHAQLEEHLRDLSVPTIPSDLFEGEEEVVDVLYESHPCEREGCESSFKNRRCLLFHTTLKHDSLHRCPACEKPFVFYSELRDHIEERHNWEKRLLPCLLPLCGKAFESKRALFCHTIHAHPLLKGKEINQDETPHHHPPQSFWRKMTSNLMKDREFRAKKKKKGNASIPSSSIPSRTVRPKPPPPLLIPKKVKRVTLPPNLHSLPPRSDVLTHPTNRLIPRNGTFQKFCPFCSRAFRTHIARDEHLRRTHGLDLSLPKPFMCADCSFSTKFGGRFIVHLRDQHPGVEEALLRRSLAEDRAAEGGEPVIGEGGGGVRPRVCPSTAASSSSSSSVRPSLAARTHLKQFRVGGDGSRFICPDCPPPTHPEKQKTYKTARSMVVHLRTHHPDSPHLHPDTAAEGVAKRSKQAALPRRRAQQWKIQLKKRKTHLLRRTKKKTPEESESEEEVAPEEEEEEEEAVEAEPLPPPPLNHDEDDDEACEREETVPQPVVLESLPPRPNFLLLSPKIRFLVRDRGFPIVCSLCSRSFREKRSLSAHYSGTHGLDLTLPRPLSCPVPGCDLAFPAAKGRLLIHLRAKHHRSMEMEWLKQNLAQDTAAAAEGGLGVVQAEGSGSKKTPAPQRRRVQHWKIQLQKRKAHHLRRTGVKKISPKRTRPSLPPRPNLLLLSLEDRFCKKSRAFPAVCSLCSRSFRNKADRSAHYSETHGLDLSLPRPLPCPVEGCGFVAITEGGRLRFHLRAKHPPSVEEDFIRKSLAEDAAAENPHPPPEESESEEEVAPEEEEVEAEPLPSPPLDQEMNDDEDEAGELEETALQPPVAVGQLQLGSLPPRPNLLFLPHKRRFQPRNHPKFPAVCNLCSRSFRHKLDLSAHYSGTHGLDLTLPRPLFCPSKGCDLAFPMAKGRLLLHLRAKHPRSVEMEWLKQNLAQDAAVEGGKQEGQQVPSLEVVAESSSIKKASSPQRKRRGPFWKIQLKKRKTHLLRRTSQKNQRDPSWKTRRSNPPRPNLLLLSLKDRFRMRNSAFPAVCILCSRSFRNKADRAEHYSWTHGLDLSLPRPLSCPVEGCGFAAALVGGQLRQHLRDKHSPSVEDALIRKSLTEDAAAVHANQANQSPHPFQKESESEEEFENEAAATPPPPPSGLQESLPPRPNLLLLPPNVRFLCSTGTFSKVCPLCSRRFRNKADRSAHFSATHGLDLTLPCPLSCPVEGCGFTAAVLGGSFRHHLRNKHSPSVDEDLIRKSLAEDAAWIQEKASPHPPEESESEEEVAPPRDDDVAVVGASEETTFPSKIRRSLPPRPNLLLLSLKDRFRVKNSAFPAVCSLCSRSFRNKADRAEHYSGTHGLDLTLPRPLSCPSKRCRRTFPMGRLLHHLRRKHPPSVEDALIRKSLAEDAAAEGAPETNQPPPPKKDVLKRRRSPIPSTSRKDVEILPKKPGRPPGKRENGIKSLPKKIQNLFRPPPPPPRKHRRIHWKTLRLQREKKEENPPSSKEDEEQLGPDEGVGDSEMFEADTASFVDDEVPPPLSPYSPSYQPPPSPPSPPSETASTSPTPTTLLKQTAQSEELSILPSPPTTRSPTPPPPQKEPAPLLTNTRAIAFLTEAGLLGRTNPSRITCPLCPRRVGRGKIRKEIFSEYVHLVHHLRHFCPTWKTQQQWRQSPPSTLDGLQNQQTAPPPPPQPPKRRRIVVRSRPKHKITSKSAIRNPLPPSAVATTNLRPTHHFLSGFDRKANSDLTRLGLLEKIDSTQIQCPLCPENEKGKHIFSTLHRLWHHLQRSCAQFKLLYPEEQVFCQGGEWSCGWCSSSFRLPQNLARHMTVVHGETVSREERKAHFQQLKMKLHTCPRCGRRKKSRTPGDHVCRTSAQQKKMAKAKAGPGKKRKRESEDGDVQQDAERKRTPNKKMKRSITKPESPPLSPEDEEKAIFQKFPELKKVTIRVSIPRLPDPVKVEEVEAGSSSEDNSESETETESEEEEVSSPGLRCSTCLRTFMSTNSLWAHEKTYQNLGKLCSQNSQSPLSPRKGGGGQETRQPRRKKAKLDLHPPPPPAQHAQDLSPSPSDYEDSAGEVVGCKCEFCEDWFSSEDEKYAHTLENHLQLFLHNT